MIYKAEHNKNELLCTLFFPKNSIHNIKCFEILNNIYLSLVSGFWPLETYKRYKF